MAHAATPMVELMKAVAKRDDANILKLLTAKKFSINEADQHGNTPLNYACAMGVSAPVILKMIELGADVTIANKTGAVPLTHAVYSKLDPNVIEALVKAGADVNFRNESGGTALQIACVCKAGLALVQKLVELGASVDQDNNHGHTALMFAVRNHNEMEVVSYLAERTKTVNHKIHLDDPKYPGFTALHFAAGEHLPAQAAILIKAGADTSLTNAEGFTSLQLADENTKTAMMSASFAKFSLENPPPPDAIPAGDAPKKRTGPLRRTSLLAQAVVPPVRESSTAGASSPGDVKEDDLEEG